MSRRRRQREHPLPVFTIYFDPSSDESDDHESTNRGASGAPLEPPAVMAPNNSANVANNDGDDEESEEERYNVDELSLKDFKLLFGLNDYFCDLVERRMEEGDIRAYNAVRKAIESIFMEMADKDCLVI